MIKAPTILILFLSNILCSQSVHDKKYATNQDSSFNFYFGSNEYLLNKNSAALFEKFHLPFKSCLSCKYELMGYADSIGDEKKNFMLSQKRLNSVKKLFFTIGITNFSVLPFGELHSRLANNNQDFRKVSLTVRDTFTSKPAINSEIETLLTKRFKEFSFLETPIRLNILFFVNSTDFTIESMEDLELLYQYLIKNPDLKMEVYGHVFCFNDRALSLNRAHAVVNYLYKKGIEISRMTSEGFGNTQAKFDETKGNKEYAKEMNRRCEVYFYK